MNKVDYLRISLTDRCNFRCQYCMPVGEKIQYQPHPELLSNDEVLTLVRDVFAPVFNFIRSKESRILNTKMSTKNKKSLEIIESNERGQCPPYFSFS
jgi:MoaA/NifB/PqqE/SkfB family radical SAM enzyme